VQKHNLWLILSRFPRSFSWVSRDRVDDARWFGQDRSIRVWIQLPLTPSQAVPCRAIATERSEAQLLIPPCSLMIFIPPRYNQLSNEQGVKVEILFIRSVSYTRSTVFHLPSSHYGAIPVYAITRLSNKKNIAIPNLLKTTQESAIVFVR
jgi:hypothetical protein